MYSPRSISWRRARAPVVVRGRVEPLRVAAQPSVRDATSLGCACGKYPTAAARRITLAGTLLRSFAVAELSVLAVAAAPQAGVAPLSRSGRLRSSSSASLRSSASPAVLGTSRLELRSSFRSVRLRAEGWEGSLRFGLRPKEGPNSSVNRGRLCARQADVTENDESIGPIFGDL